MKLKILTTTLLTIFLNTSNAAFTPDGMFYLGPEDLAPTLGNTYSPRNSYSPWNNYSPVNSYPPWNDSEERLREREVDALEGIQYNLRKLFN
jgi:hypothetical protein